MEDTYEGYWYRSDKGSGSLDQCGLYRENKYHPDNIYDDVTDESHIDDRVADKENEKLLAGSEITMGIQEFLEIGMKYKIKIEANENRYLLRIETV